MSTAFVNNFFQNKPFINGCTFTSSTFGTTVDVPRNSWVGDTFTLKSFATALKIRVFPDPAPVFFRLIVSIIRSDLLLLSALTLLLLKPRAISKGLLAVVKLYKNFLGAFFELTDSVKWSLNSFAKRFSLLVCTNSTLFSNMFFAFWREHTLDRMLYLWWYKIELLVWPSKQMVCSRRLRILSRDKGGVSDFLAFSNFNHTLDKGPITERVLFCIFLYYS